MCEDDVYKYSTIEGTKKEKPSRFLLSWGTGIRTPIGRSRVGSPTVERYPNAFHTFVKPMIQHGVGNVK